LAVENKKPAFELQWPGTTPDPFTSRNKFFKMCNFDHGVNRRKGILRHRRPSNAMRHARISTGLLSADIRHRAAALPDVPAPSHAAVEA
jgi:hypothetical protein